MKRSAAWMLTLAALAGTGAAAAQTHVDLSELDRGMAGSRAQVLVLGSMHLSSLGKDFKPESLEPVIERLAAFKPQIITVESISGESCDLMARHPVVYGKPEDNRFCASVELARKATGLDVPAAIGEVHKTLRDWPTAPTPAQRRRLAALFLASNEDESALVQWLQLPTGERHSGEGLDDALVAQLEKYSGLNSESLQIGARLAARLGLQRLYPIDDHTGDNITVPDDAAFGAALQKAWDSQKPRTAPLFEREDALAKANDMLALYRLMNRAENLRLVVDTDIGASMRDTAPDRPAQWYVAGWETRNLRMVANIRATFRERPGARVLSIVGRTHKPWFDDLLGQMQGVDIVDAEKVLGAK
jgi:hypothetical protein